MRGRGFLFIGPQHCIHFLKPGYEDSFLGLPPARFFRRACSWRKYSGPRLAMAWPPIRPRPTANGFFSLEIGGAGVPFLFAMTSILQRAPVNRQEAPNYYADTVAFLEAFEAATK
jgi:hypothetical protein